VTTDADAIATLQADVASLTTIAAWRVTVRWPQDPTPWPDLLVELDAKGKVTKSSVRK
jgi:hypothetical protein